MKPSVAGHIRLFSTVCPLSWRPRLSAMLRTTSTGVAPQLWFGFQAESCLAWCSLGTCWVRTSLKRAFQIGLGPHGNNCSARTAAARSALQRCFLEYLFWELWRTRVRPAATNRSIGGMPRKRGMRCSHPGCECPVAKGRKYCSPYCESVGDRPSIACECGHAECNAGVTVGAAG